MVTPEQIDNAGLDAWTRSGDTLRATFDTGSWADGMRFLNAVSEEAEAANHHPDVTLTYPSVEISLTTHDQGGLTEKDLDLAATIDRIAADQGVPAAGSEG